MCIWPNFLGKYAFYLFFLYICNFIALDLFTTSDRHYFLSIWQSKQLFIRHPQDTHSFQLMFKYEIFKNQSDLLGIISASLCVVHCLATPFILLLFTQLHWWHDLSFIFLVISGIAVYLSTRTSHHKTWKTVIWASFSVLTVAVFMEESIEWMHEVSYVASAGLVIGHYFNQRHTIHCQHDWHEIHVIFGSQTVVWLFLCFFPQAA